MNVAQTKQHLVALLHAGHAVTVRWDCGGDESFVYTSVDGVEVQPPFADELGKTVFFEHEWEPPYRAMYVNREGQTLAIFGENDFAYGLDQLLTGLLGLPSVGEFEMTGGGRFFLEGNAVGVEYESAAKVYWDESEYGELTEQEQDALAALGVERSAPAAEPTTPAEPEVPAETGGSPDAQMSADFSGRRILFELPAA